MLFLNWYLLNSFKSNYYNKDLILNPFFRRWFCSTNHKDIGTLYLISGIFAGFIGTDLSVAIRLELAQPGSLLFRGNMQLCNVFITAHAFLEILLIFFYLLKIFGIGTYCVLFKKLKNVR